MKNISMDTRKPCRGCMTKGKKIGERYEKAVPDKASLKEAAEFYRRFFILER